MKDKIIKPVIVLTCIALVCATVLTLVNHFWSFSDEERFAMSVKSIVNADSFRVVYDFDTPSAQHKTTEEYAAIVAFNTEFGVGIKKVNKVRIAVGGADDGCYVIQSTGRGYKDAFVQILTGYDSEGKIMGTVRLNYDSTNNLIGNINFDKVSSAVKGKEDSVGTGSDIIAKTGATKTLDGVAEAINISTLFFQNVILGNKEQPQAVTDAAGLANLNALFNQNSAFAGTVVEEYISYPIRLPETVVSGGRASVSRVIVGDGSYLILEVNGRYGDYGGWTLLVLVDEAGSVAAVSPTWTGLDVGKDENGNTVNASALNSAVVLTDLFRGKSVADIEAMDKYLAGTTHATETNRGLKLTVAHAINSVGAVRDALLNFEGEE